MGQIKCELRVTFMTTLVLHSSSVIFETFVSHIQ